MWPFKKKTDVAKSSDHEHFHLYAYLRNYYDQLMDHTRSISSWLHYFQARHAEHDSKFKEIEHFYEKRLHFLEKKLKDFESRFAKIPDKHLDEFMDAFYASKVMDKRFVELHRRVSTLESKPLPVSQKPVSTRSPVKEVLMKKISRNSKDYIKSVIVDQVSKLGKISSSQLKEIIVDEKKVCSKSSFYRIMGELETDGEFSTITSQTAKYIVYNR